MREDAGELVEKRVLTVVCKKPRRHQVGETNRCFSRQLRNCKRDVRRPQDCLYTTRWPCGQTSRLVITSRRFGSCPFDTVSVRLNSVLSRDQVGRNCASTEFVHQAGAQL